MVEEPSAQGEIRIDATPEQVYAVVSDPVLMASMASELHEVKWRDSGAKAQVGARFVGRNRNGWRRWSTQCVVTEAQPGRAFAYDVSVQGIMSIAHWRYDIEPDGDGSRVSEKMWITEPRWFLPVGALISGKPDRAAANAQHIAETLERLKRHCESQTVGS